MMRKDCKKFVLEYINKNLFYPVQKEDNLIQETVATIHTMSMKFWDFQELLCSLFLKEKHISYATSIDSHEYFWYVACAAESSWLESVEFAFWYKGGCITKTTILCCLQLFLLEFGSSQIRVWISWLPGIRLCFLSKLNIAKCIVLSQRCYICNI